MIRVHSLIKDLTKHINDSRFSLEIKEYEEGLSFKASFYNDYYYVDKETRMYSITELNFLETFCGAMLDDIAEAIHYVFDCHALNDNLTKEILNKIEERICKNGRN